MKLDVRALTLVAAILWGGAILLTGLLNLLFPAYGGAFLELAASIYPGYHGPQGLGSVVVATLYGLLDGAVAGFLLAWLYNLLVREPGAPAEAE